MNNIPVDLDPNDTVAREAYETFTRHFAAVVRRDPERTIFRLKTPDGYASVSYGEAYRRIRGVALGLLSLGVRRGERVAILAENRPEWVVSYLGSYFAGTIAVPLDTQISPEEWRRLIEDSETRAVFVSSLLAEKLLAALNETIPLERIIVFDTANSSCAADIAGCVRFDEFIEQAHAVENPPELAESTAEDVVTIIYTSGTTGHPKGVPLTHANIMGELRGLYGVIHIAESDALLCLLPLQHVLASIANVLLPLAKGGYVVFADTLKRAEIMQAMAEAGITILATVPQFFYLFHNRIQEELSRKSPLARRAFRGLLALNHFSLRYLKLNLGKMLFAKVHRSFGSRLRLFFSGGSGIDVKVLCDFQDMGFTIMQGYGLTETAGACALNSVEANTVGSVGPALPGAEIKILAPDETGVGEILVRGSMVMTDYYKNPDATRDAIVDGWFHSGDLGFLDARGNLFITGRKKEVIVPASGKNIYPDELELHYLQCQYIQELAVIGVRSEDGRGEKLHAVVVPDFDRLKSKKIANTREVLGDEIAALSSKLPKYKRLMSYQIQAEPLPRTTTRKIKRLEIKRQVESGELRASNDDTASDSTISTEDQVLLESAVGQEVLNCLRETCHRDETIAPGMNLELDLGFDSMTRVELLSSLEERLNFRLPDDAAAEILTVGNLITQIEKASGAVTPSGTRVRQSWKTILAEKPTDGKTMFRPSGMIVSVLKFMLLKTLYYGICKPFLRLETRGLEHIPKTGPCLICPNHQSYIDPFVLIAALPFGVFRRMFYVGYSAFFTNPIMKAAARITSVIPVDPDTHLLGAMQVSAEGLRNGGILCIFPEGGRSFDGEMMEFKKGAAILARELSIPIIPAAIAGAYEVWARNSRRIRLHKVRVAFGKGFRLEENAAAVSEDLYQKDTNRLRQAVGRLFDDLRSAGR